MRTALMPYLAKRAEVKSAVSWSGALAGVGQVHAPELDRRAVLEGEAVLDHADAAVLARGAVEPAVHVDDARDHLLRRLEGEPVGTGQGPAELVEVGLGGEKGRIVGEGQRQRHGALALGEQVGRQHHAHAVVERDGARRVELHRDRAALVEGEIGLRRGRRRVDAAHGQRHFGRLALGVGQGERPLAALGVEVEAGDQQGEGHVLGRLQVVAEGHLPGARLPGLEVDVDHLALVLVDDEGDVGRELSVLGLLVGIQPDPGPARPPAAEAEVEDRPVVAEEAERQRVVRIDQGAPRLGRGRGGGQDQEGGQRRPTGSSDDAGASPCFLEHADLLRGALGLSGQGRVAVCYAVAGPLATIR